MFKVDKINYDESLVIRLVVNIVSKTPGVNLNDQFTVNINNKHTVLDVHCKPLPDIINVYSLAKKIQDNIYYNLCKIFDLNKIIVNITMHGDENV